MPFDSKCGYFLSMNPSRFFMFVRCRFRLCFRLVCFIFCACAPSCPPFPPGLRFIEHTRPVRSQERSFVVFPLACYRLFGSELVFYRTPRTFPLVLCADFAVLGYFDFPCLRFVCVEKCG